MLDNRHCRHELPPCCHLCWPKKAPGRWKNPTSLTHHWQKKKKKPTTQQTVDIVFDIKKTARKTPKPRSSSITFTKTSAQSLSTSWRGYQGGKGVAPSTSPSASWQRSWDPESEKRNMGNKLTSKIPEKLYSILFQSLLFCVLGAFVRTSHFNRRLRKQWLHQCLQALHVTRRSETIDISKGYKRCQNHMA